MRRQFFRYIAVTLLAATPLFAGCGDDEELIGEDAGDAGTDGTETDGAANDVSLPSDASDGGAAADAGEAEASDATTVLTDLQIIWVLHVYNRSVIDQGQLALMRAVTTEARAFANAMITAHTAEDAALAALFESPDAEAGADAGGLDATLLPDGGIPVAESATSRALAQQSALQITELGLKSNTAFDLSYMSGQVASHSEIVQLIDDVLSPQALDPALKTNIAQTRVTETAHLANAIQTLNTIAANAAD
jgi:putative membrane protein